MACSICSGKSNISKTMNPTRSATVPTRTLGSNSAAVFSNTSPRTVSHATNVTPTAKPGSTARLPKVGK